MRSIRLVLIALLAIAGLADAVSSQTPARPDFTGTWMIDTGRSDFGPAPVPKVYTLTITHKDPNVTVNREVETQKDSTAFRTDGVDTKSDTDCCGPVVTTGRWDGATLRRRVVNENFAQVDVWSLSADGKTLTIVREINQDSGEGAFKLRMVFTKKN